LGFHANLSTKLPFQVIAGNVKNRFLTFLLSLCVGGLLLPVRLAAQEQPLIFAGDANLPPVEWTENDVPRGLNVDVIRAISRAMGRDIEVRLMDWQEAQDMVLECRVDALTLLSQGK